MTKINFDSIKQLSNLDNVLFIRPFLCKTIRVLRIPDVYITKGKYKEIVEILNATASFKKEGVFYYRPEDIDMVHEALYHFRETLGIIFFCAEQEEPQHGMDDKNKPIAEILN